VPNPQNASYPLLFYLSLQLVTSQSAQILVALLGLALFPTARARLSSNSSTSSGQFDGQPARLGWLGLLYLVVQLCLLVHWRCLHSLLMAGT
jgi:hypothetical protein